MPVAQSKLLRGSLYEGMFPRFTTFGDGVTAAEKGGLSQNPRSPLGIAGP